MIPFDYDSPFYFNDTATTEIYTLSLHDALPISPCSAAIADACQLPAASCRLPASSFQLPASSYQLPVAGCRLPVAGCRLQRQRRPSDLPTKKRDRRNAPILLELVTGSW